MGGKPRTNDPMEMLTRSHRRILETVDEMSRAAAAGEADPREWNRVTECVAFILEQGQRHELDEEQSFFPRLRGKADRALLETLAADHRTHETMAKDLDALLAGPFDADDKNTARQMVKDLTASIHSHVGREESELWPAIMANLLPDELSAAMNEMNARRGR